MSDICRCHLTHFLVLNKEEAPVCDTCNLVITTKHFLIKLERNVLKKNPLIHYLEMSAPREFLSSREKLVYSDIYIDWF